MNIMKLSELHEAKIKQYNSTEINDTDELIELLNDHCSQAVESHLASDQGQIWRGVKSPKPNGIYDPSSGERQSQNTSNYYTTWLDTNNANNAFPKRSRSFVCSTDMWGAMNYGRGTGAAYSVFPFDNAKIGCINKDDLWNIEVNILSLGIHKTSLPALNNFFKAALFDVGEGSIPSFEELKNLIIGNPEIFIRGFTDRARIKISEKENFEYVAQQLVKDVNKIYNFEKIGCTLQDIKNFKCQDSEVWFSDKCILIEKDQWEKIRANL